MVYKESKMHPQITAIISALGCTMVKKGIYRHPDWADNAYEPFS